MERQTGWSFVRSVRHVADHAIAGVIHRTPIGALADPVAAYPVKTRSSRENHCCLFRLRDLRRAARGLSPCLWSRRSNAVRGFGLLGRSAPEAPGAPAVIGREPC